MRLSILILGFVLLGGCASNVPKEIRDDISGNNISIKAAASNFEQNKGLSVRWGGTIAKVENNASDTWIEIVGRRLGSYGQPLDSDQSLGRFIARVDGFLDPAIYKEDREITIYGRVENRVVREIDNHPYTYPLVMVLSHYLWSEYQEPYYYPYDPYYYAYPYPYGYYPYYYRYRFGFRLGYYPSYYPYGLSHRHHHHW